VRGDQLALLSRHLGRPVISSDGVKVGRVVDLTVLYDIAHPAVHRIGVGRGRRIRYLMPQALVRTRDDRQVGVAIDRMGLSAYASSPDPRLEDPELLLARDVLDTQVVDLAGRRLSRVSDVIMATERDGRFEVVAVDVGTGSLLRRMGFGWLGERLDPVAVDWAELHLTSRRGHVVQLATATTAMHRCDPSDLAHLLARLSPEMALDVVRAMHPARSAAALHASHADLRRRLLQSLSAEELRQLVDAAPPAVARVLAELPTSRAPTRRQLRTSGWRVPRPPEAHPPAGVSGRR
jgi:sporulation protein YlmC with PRC-barrel domain